MAHNFESLASTTRLSYVLEFIYIDLNSLQRLVCVSKAIHDCLCIGGRLIKFRAHFGQLFTNPVKILLLDLTLEVEPNPDSPVPSAVEVLEVTISHALADRVDILRHVLSRLTCLRHIHLRLVPDPGWLIALHAEDAEDDDLNEVTTRDSDALILAKLSRCHNYQGYEHLDGSLHAIRDALADGTWSTQLSGVSVFALLRPCNLVDHLDMIGFRSRANEGAQKRGLIKDFASYITFMNEDPVSSESEWRKVRCSAGYVVVGRPVPIFSDESNYTLPENDKLGLQRILLDRGCLGNCRERDSFAFRSKYAMPFSSHYCSFAPFGKVKIMSGTCSVQVPGVFPAFSRVVGKDFAHRFIQQNPEYGANLTWEAARVYYDNILVDLQSVKNLIQDNSESEFVDDFSDFDEAEYVANAAGRGGGCGHGLRKPRFNLPSRDVDDGEARRLVENSPLKDLSPNQAGVAAETWQQLAAVAVGQPDIKWLGRVAYGGWSDDPKEQYYNDFRMIHAGQSTDLRIAGHRRRFGEKCMKYGSIDLCMRTLSIWPQGEEVGYHGVLDMFEEIECIKSFQHYWPKISYFLEADKFQTWVKPHLKSSDTTTRQHVANSILARISVMDVRSKDVSEAVCRCRDILYAEPTVADGVVCKLTCSTVWEHLFGEFVSRGREALKAYSLMLHHGHPFSEEAKGDVEEARTLRRHWDRAGGLGDWEAFVKKCQEMTAFTEEGLAELRGDVDDGDDHDDGSSDD